MTHTQYIDGKWVIPTAGAAPIPAPANSIAAKPCNSCNGCKKGQHLQHTERAERMEKIATFLQIAVSVLTLVLLLKASNKYL